jgi:uncharacterized pyridoxamine 5'-phosphate oxidase family protein
MRKYIKTYKTGKQLLSMLYNEMVSIGYTDSRGICSVVVRLYIQGKISFTERIKLENIIFDNRPSKTLHVKFFKNKIYRPVGAYWWDNTLDGWEQRELFVKKLAGIK